MTRRKRKAKVYFTGADDTTAANALTFTCALDGKARGAVLELPADVKKLKPGHHRIEVRAIDAAGNRRRRQALPGEEALVASLKGSSAKRQVRGKGAVEARGIRTS